MRFIKNIFTFSFIGLALALGLPSIAAADAKDAGKVLWVKGGTLTASQPNQPERKLERRSDIFETDTLTTDSGGTAQIVFTDETMLSLRENTSLTITRYAYTKGDKPSEEGFVANLVKGGFRTITGAIAKNNPDGYETKTPVSTMAVRSTRYAVYYSADDPKKGAVINIEEGSISVANSAGTVILTCKKYACTQRYARVTDTNKAPAIVKAKPEEFKNDVPIEMASWKQISTEGPSGGTGSTTESSTTKPAQKKSGSSSGSFCIK